MLSLSQYGPWSCSNLYILEMNVNWSPWEITQGVHIYIGQGETTGLLQLTDTVTTVSKFLLLKCDVSEKHRIDEQHAYWQDISVIIDEIRFCSDIYIDFLLGVAWYIYTDINSYSYNHYLNKITVYCDHSKAKSRQGPTGAWVLIYEYTSNLIHT